MKSKITIAAHFFRIYLMERKDDLLSSTLIMRFKSISAWPLLYYRFDFEMNTIEIKHITLTKNRNHRTKFKSNVSNPQSALVLFAGTSFEVPIPNTPVGLKKTEKNFDTLLNLINPNTHCVIIKLLFASFYMGISAAQLSEISSTLLTSKRLLSRMDTKMFYGMTFLSKGKYTRLLKSLSR